MRVGLLALYRVLQTASGASLRAYNLVSSAAVQFLSVASSLHA